GKTKADQAGDTDKPVDLWTQAYDLVPLPGDWRFYWKQGVHLDSPDDFLKLKFGGRVQWDYGWYGGNQLRDDLGIELESQSEVRRARLYMSGEMAKFLAFKFQFDFAGADTTMKAFYVRVKKLPVVGNFTIGHFYEPFGLETMTSSKHVTFIERALSDAFSPGRSWGMRLNNHAFNERMTWALGVYHSYVSDGSVRWGSSSRGQATSMTGRVTYLPCYKDKGRKLLHVGAAYSVRRPQESIKFSQRPEAHMMKTLTSTGSFYAKRVHLLGTEVAWVHGPFSVQAEYSAAGVNSQRGGDDVWLQGVYVQTSYFLTGEHRPYDTKTGVFKGVKPKKNFLTGRGIGAWEVAMRLSSIDLNDGDLSTSAHNMRDLTVGLNWYLNPNMRISGNYIRS
ncbi:hypothetical protein LCGC14_2874820, partial [marine sediment metagenome]